MTDHTGSVPLYYAQDRDQVITGKTPLEVAVKMASPGLDPVSAADFLLNGTVCYPYTLFKDVYLAPPGAVTDVTPNGIHSEFYYQPEEQCSNQSTAYWGAQLREKVQQALQKGLEGKKQVKALFSGGEDSRAVVSLLPEGSECELVTFADELNREVRLAERAARALGRPLVFIQRPYKFYQRDIQSRVYAIGGISEIRQTHVWGRLAQPLKDADAVIGGYVADSLFKSEKMGNVKRSRKRLTPETMESSSAEQPLGIEKAIRQSWINQSVAAAVDERHLAHHERIREFRPVTAANWHRLWPWGSQARSYAHYMACHLACPAVVEPFISPQVYRLAASMPEQLRVDRKAFRAAFAPAMGKAGWLPTTSGHIPRLGGYIGHWVELGTVTSRYGRDLAANVTAQIRGRIPRSQGPWGANRDLPPQEIAERLTASQRDQMRELLDVILTPAEAKAFFKPDHGVTSARVRTRALQIAYLMDWAGATLPAR
ncbi:asparagine synthase-related protein [Halorhodospira neutriphila]|uniref:asparagine synthase-related protein n=1 Tax=Halorhodospira neutriphila TaxID=168379 RepID=UPI001A9133F3